MATCAVPALGVTGETAALREASWSGGQDFWNVLFVGAVCLPSDELL